MTWSLVNSWTYSSAVANVDFTGLGSYSDIRILCRNIPTSASGQRQLLVSTNNGSTFLTTSGDYYTVNITGTETNVTSALMHVTTSASARTTECVISGFNLTSPKVGIFLSRTDVRTFVIPATSALNALRISNSGGGNLTGGSIYVFGKTVPWTLAGSWTYSSDVANVDFTGLAGYTEVRALLRGIPVSVSNVRQLQVSTNNGSTFLTTSGDYVSVASTGVETATTSVSYHTTSTTAARGGDVWIAGWNLTAPKIVQRPTRTDARTLLIPTASALNALRVSNLGGGNLTGGSIYVYAR